ncbi:MAG: PEP-CTERM sorting domain-containing protein [Blastochloris sp.]|nr:PEP-CTERM sorting domain-containing protein [Blastochloris sp.]
MDGDNIFGTDGYYLFQAEPSTPTNTSLLPFTNADFLPPNYASITSAGANGSAADTSSFQLIDDLFDPTGDDLPSGYAYRSGVMNNTEAALFNITFNLNVVPTNTYFIGIMHDNTIAADQPIALRLAGASGNSGPISLAPANNQIDYTYFQVTGLNSGDTLTLFATRGLMDGNVGVGAIFFDSIPEPSTYGLILLALALLGWQLQRQKNRSHS